MRRTAGIFVAFVAITALAGVPASAQARNLGDVPAGITKSHKFGLFEIHYTTNAASPSPETSRSFID